MTVEEAIQTALDFEHRVRSVYQEAAARAVKHEIGHAMVLLSEVLHIDLRV